MKKTIIAVAALLASSTAFADHYVQGHTTKNGEYVQGHNQSDPNGTVMDNYSHKDNTNPYTGQTGGQYDRNAPSSNYYGTQPQVRTNPYDPNKLYGQ